MRRYKAKRGEVYGYRRATATVLLVARPRQSDERRKAASKGGRSKPSREIRDLKKQLEDLAAGVLDGTVDRGNAVVVNQILNTRLRAIELERKIRDQEEIAERIAELEKEGARWGA